jgi:hypothetical protein
MLAGPQPSADTNWPHDFGRNLELGAVQPIIFSGKVCVGGVMSSPGPETLLPATTDDGFQLIAAGKPQRRRTTPPKIDKIAPPTVAPMFGTLTKLGHRMPTWKSRHFVLVRTVALMRDGSSAKLVFLAWKSCG